MSPTTGDPAGEPLEPLPAACEELCAAMTACGLGGEEPQCSAGCVDIVEPGSECAELLAAEWDCVAALPCADLEQFLFVEPHMCLDELQAYDACTFPDCAVYTGGDVDTCNTGRTCMGVTQELRCEGDTCTCFEDEVPQKTCPNDGFCADIPGSLTQADALACCQWDWS